MLFRSNSEKLFLSLGNIAGFFIQNHIIAARLLHDKVVHMGCLCCWIKATNAVIRDIKKKITLLFDWIAEAKAELAKPQAPDLVSLLNAYYTQRKAGAYSQKGKISNLKEMNDTFNYLRANGIYSLEDLERRVSEHSARSEEHTSELQSPS